MERACVVSWFQHGDYKLDAPEPEGVVCEDCGVGCEFSLCEDCEHRRFPELDAESDDIIAPPDLEDAPLLAPTREEAAVKPADITPRQREAFDFIDSTVRRGRTPTVGELASALGISSPSATRLVGVLESKGLIGRVNGGIRLRTTGVFFPLIGDPPCVSRAGIPVGLDGHPIVEARS
jgi:hypothetical protein